MAFFDQVTPGSLNHRIGQRWGAVLSLILGGVRQPGTPRHAATYRLLAFMLVMLAELLLSPVPSVAESHGRARASLVVSAYVLPIIDVAAVESKIVGSSQRDKSQLIIQLPSTRTAAIESLTPLNQSPWAATVPLTGSALRSSVLGLTRPNNLAGINFLENLVGGAPQTTSDEGSMLRTYTYVTP